MFTHKKRNTRPTDIKKKVRFSLDPKPAASGRKKLVAMRLAPSVARHTVNRAKDESPKRQKRAGPVKEDEAAEGVSGDTEGTASGDTEADGASDPVASPVLRSDVVHHLPPHSVLYGGETWKPKNTYGSVLAGADVGAGAVVAAPGGAESTDEEGSVSPRLLLGRFNAVRRKIRKGAGSAHGFVIPSPITSEDEESILGVPPTVESPLARMTALYHESAATGINLRQDLMVAQERIKGLEAQVDIQTKLIASTENAAGHLVEARNLIREMKETLRSM